MAINFKPIIVFDFETDGTDPQVCSAIQLAAIAIDPRSLTVVPGSEFEVKMLPDFDKSMKSTIDFHARRRKMDADSLTKEWATYTDPKIAWPQFTTYLKQYHLKQDRQTKFTAPIAAGANIMKFDIPIAERYEQIYGQGKPLFSPRDVIDLLHWFFPWFENNGDVTSYAMDNMREYFGMSNENAHDALQDCKDCAELIIRFMKLHRATAEKVKFKGAFKNEVH